MSVATHWSDSKGLQANARGEVPRLPRQACTCYSQRPIPEPEPWFKPLSRMIIALVFGVTATVAYANDGAIDTSFGPDAGIALPFFDQGGAQYANQDIGHALMRQDDGKYVLAGNVRVGDQGAGHWDGGLARLNSDGSADTSFNSTFGSEFINIGGGRLLVDIAGDFQGLTDALIYSINPEPAGGYAVLSGEAINSTGTHYGWFREINNLQYLTGISQLGPADSYYAHGVYPPGDNTVLFLSGGRRQSPNADMDVYVRIVNTASINPNPIFEATLALNRGGGNNDYGQQAAYAFIPGVCFGGNCLLARERFYVVGYSDTSNGYGDCFVRSFSRAVLNGTWATDVSFTPTINFDNAVIPNQPTHTLCHAIAVQPDGKILIGGEAYVRVQGSQTDNASYWVVARLNANGSLDTGFNAGGPMPGAKAYFFEGVPTTADVYNGIYSLAVQQDGRIVFAGYAGTTLQSHGYADMGFGRLRADGTLDAGFGTGGISIVTLDSGNGTGHREFALGAILEPGRIVGVGTRQYSGDDYDYMATRLLDDDLIFADGFDAQ